jgi:hypothetical protein
MVDRTVWLRASRGRGFTLAAMPGGPRNVIVVCMSPFVLMTLVAAVLIARKLVDIYAGGHYVCPSCGARSEGRHSRDCPWSRLNSG